ncbi:MAG: peptidylprolyl isomerase, partial [Actinomycetota bacterium]|nr:peptidylprolyl isomerase [Actinomycetota bacterium]
MPTDKRERQRAGRESRRAEARAAQRRAARRRQIIGIVALLAAVVGIGLFISLGDDGTTDVATEDGATTTSVSTPEAGPAVEPVCPPAEGATERQANFTAAPPDCLAEGASYAAEVETDIGSFTIDLDRTKAPKTVNNFVFLARSKAYDGVPFHRVIQDFVVQGGDVALQN